MISILRFEHHLESVLPGPADEAKVLELQKVPDWIEFREYEPGKSGA